MNLFTQMCSAAAQDLDGDGKLSAGDRFGSLSDLHSGRALLWSSGMELCTHDENGNLVPTLTTEKNYDIFKSVLAFYEDNANSYGGDNGRMFMADQALFLMSSIDGAVQLRDMESDFGAIPYPKYDAADESYRSRNFGSSYFAIPITANNADMSATVLEAAKLLQLPQTFVLHITTPSSRAKYHATRKHVRCSTLCSTPATSTRSSSTAPISRS